MGIWVCHANRDLCVHILPILPWPQFHLNHVLCTFTSSRSLKQSTKRELNPHPSFHRGRTGWAQDYYTPTTNYNDYILVKKQADLPLLLAQTTTKKTSMDHPGKGWSGFLISLSKLKDILSRNKWLWFIFACQLRVICLFYSFPLQFNFRMKISSTLSFHNH